MTVIVAEDDLEMIEDDSSVIEEDVTLIEDAFFPETLPDNLTPEIIHNPNYKIPGQLTVHQFNLLSAEEQANLWTDLNSKHSKVFVPCVERIDLIGRDFLRLKQAIAEDPRKATKPHDHLWCPTCGNWRIFKTHSYLGYERCIACGLTTADYYVSIDNKLNQHSPSSKKTTSKNTKKVNLCQ